ncbi:hypothetical protein IP69_02320 [Bosea sp. AAP35]|nr:hypothetical protein IP69_02320 [Bosea sp. AAP35]
MPFHQPTRMSFLPLLIVVAGAMSAAGCAGGAGKVVAEAAGMATTPQEAKPFVQESRPIETDYVPVGSTITRAAPRRPVADFKTMEAELEAQRISNEAAGNQARALGATPPPKPAVLPTN